MIIIFATNDSKQKSQILNGKGIKERLVSYYYVRNSHENFIPCYAKNGMSPFQYEKSKLVGKKRIRLKTQKRIMLYRPIKVAENSHESRIKRKRPAI